MKAHDLHNLAVLFRVNSPDIGHCTTLDAMNEAGLGYAFGLLRGTPERYKTRRAALRESIANKLEQKATIARQKAEQEKPRRCPGCRCLFTWGKENFETENPYCHDCQNHTPTLP